MTSYIPLFDAKGVKTFALHSEYTLAYTVQGVNRVTLLRIEIDYIIQEAELTILLVIAINISWLIPDIYCIKPHLQQILGAFFFFFFSFFFWNETLSSFPLNKH